MERHLFPRRVVLSLLSGAFLIFCVSCSEPKKPDAELYQDFYNDIIARTTSFDQKYAPFIKSVTTNNEIEAIGIASEIDKDLLQLWGKIERTGVPVLDNKEASSELQRAKDYLSAAYLNKLEVLDEYLKYSKNPSLFSMATIKRKADKTQAQLLLGLASLLSSGAKLGLTPDEITGGKKSYTAGKVPASK
ncbi:MAG TPA: hypothetical protein PK587_04270 [Syntrophales bacterium]|nr:hypothetical protein [Syntrophales bacterium]